MRWLLTLFLISGITFIGFSQKGKGGGGNKDVILFTCIQVLENGLIQAQFGYTNPTNKDITVGEDESVVFLSDKDDDDESNGIRKILVEVTTFEKNTTNENAFSVTFNSSGHAKWTVTFGNNETKIRATAASTVCVEPCIVCPVYGGAGKSFTPLGSELTALATGNAGDQPSDIIYQFNPADNTEVLIEIVPKVGRMSFVLDLLEDPTPNGFARVYDTDPLFSDFIIDPAIIESIDPVTQATKYATIDVYFPISRLLELNNYPDDLNFSRSLYTPIRQAGVTTTKGDNAMLTNKVRESFVLRDEIGNPIPVIGDGISVAVISDSFDKRLYDPNPEENIREELKDVKTRDLPGDLDEEGNAVLDEDGNVVNGVNVLKDYPGKASDEGRAMLQLIHDVAPGATLGFSTGVLSPRDMALAIDNLALEGYDIITDDITYPLEPFYDDFTTDTYNGSIANAIKRFTDEGGIYVTSAGNFANTGYQSVFVSSMNTPVTVPPLDPGTVAHVFEGQAVKQEIEVDPGTYFLVLQWDENQASQNNSMGAATDLDIYILSETGQILVNNNRLNDFGDSAEAVIFQSVAENARANIMITSANNDNPVDLAFRYIIYRSDGLQILEYNTGTPTITGHAMTPEAITVGAVDYRLPLKGETLIPEGFSSYGGDLLNGTELNVDIAAPDGGNTTVLSIGNDIDDPTEDDPNDPDNPDKFLNFFGTSAAAPHVAGAAALLLSTALPPSEPGAYSPSWYPDGLPVEVLELFQNNAIAVSDNPDFSMGSGVAQTGSGLINVVEAFKDIAVQTAVINSFEIVPEPGEEGTPPDPIPGVDTYYVTISGNYIPEDPADVTVFLGDEQLQILGEITDTEITAISVVPFVGNPELTVFTNSGDLPGGGQSNGLSILPDGKLALRITANNSTVEFGDTPQFTYKVEGLPKLEGLPDYDEVVFGLLEGETLNTALENINAALTDLGEPILPLLPEVVVESTASGDFPQNVGFYPITSDFGGVELTPEQLAAYQINFINTGEEAGLFTVNKKDLIIEPADASIVYGEAVNVQLNYFGVDEEGGKVTFDSAFEETIRIDHSNDFFNQDNVPTFLVINKLRAVVNSEDLQKIQGLLDNGSSWMSGNKIIQNKLRAVVNGEMNLIDLEAQNFKNYFNIDSLPIGNKLRAVVNKLRAVVNGQDLLNGDMQLQLLEEDDPDNVFQNKLRAVVNGTPIQNQEGETGFEAYNKIFAVVDFEDGTPADEDGNPIDPEQKLNVVYATNLLSGLDVTPVGDPSKIYPGAFLSNFGTNFNKQYRSADLTVSPATLSVQTPNMEIEYGTTLTIADITSVIDGYVYEETSETAFPDGIPYYFIKTPLPDDFENRLEIDELEEFGEYRIKIGYPQDYTPQNYTITNIVDEDNGTLTLNKAVLYAETEDLVIDQGAIIDTSSLTTPITGYVTGETQDDVFPVGIQYSIEDEEGNAYTPGANGVYFIKIMEPQNYRIEYIHLGTVYINSNDANRKIRTYTDCVEENPGDPDDLNYIAHFRYVNPNDEAIYILEGPENQLTGPAALTAIGELPVKFLPGEHTFEIRFNGDTLKWELISLNSNHKTSTTTNVNANSNQCDSSNTTNESGIPIYNLYPNPVKEVSTCIGCEPGILYIEQDISADVTLNVFDFYGRQIPIVFNRITPLNGTLDMNGLETGIYFIRLSTGNDVQVFSVVKE
ncbi:MAG: S8 family serine peptidase [Eudoraea sp.]|uniref:S8 family serine peptidase n=1 Tax=Eudoraea sp. TaxID=1979955 RepID=UPI003C75C896